MKSIALMLFKGVIKDLALEIINETFATLVANNVTPDQIKQKLIDTVNAKLS